MFESDRDAALFVRRLAHAVEQGWVEVHAFVVMQTHFHLLIVSVTGELSRALHYLEGPYAQYFNRTRERDGPLHRGRFLAKRVGSEVYRRRLVSYIDGNPVAAKLVRDPAAYPHGSARLFACTRSPDWHARWWVEEQVKLRTGEGSYDPARYRDAFPLLEESSPDDPMILASGVRFREDGPVDFLLRASDDGRSAWLRELAERADGMPFVRPLVPAAAVRDAVLRSELTSAPAGARKGTATERSVATVLLLRSLAGSTLADAARDLGCSEPTASRISRLGARMLAEDADFAREVACAMRDALDATYGRWCY